MRRGAAVLAAVAALAFALPPAAAQADGDPASDTIISLPAFLPFTPPVSGAIGRRLFATVRAAQRKGQPLKVAVISSAPDLGSVSSLFGRPQAYATFLSREDAFAVKVPVLVVMPQGFGFAKVGKALDRGSFSSVKVPAGPDSNGLATAATQAVEAYAGVTAPGGGGGAGVAPPPVS